MTIQGRAVVKGDVHGAGEESNSVIKNRLNISDGSIIGYAFAGGSYSNIVERNTLEMTGGTITKDACGGHGHMNDMINNKLNISGGTIVGNACGGRSWNKGNAKGNILEMKGGTIAGDVYGGYSSKGDAIKNRLTITNGDIGGDAYGGRAFENGIVEGNILEMTGGTITKDAYGGYGNNGSAINNTFNISSGTIKGNVIGGRGNLEANNNKVIISGGEILGNVHGGTSEKGEAVCNTIEISGAPKFSSNTVIYGGYSPIEAAEVYIGNTLNLETEGQVVLKGIKNFEKYNFEKVIVNAPAVLKVVDEVNLTRSEVVVKVEGEAKEGNIVNVIESDGMVSTAESIKLYKNELGVYEYERVVNPNMLVLVIRGVKLIPQTQVINEVASAGIVLVGQGIGFIADRGVEEAVGAVKGKGSIEVFGVVEGDNNRYKNETEVKIEGVKVVVGVAKSMEEGKVVIGGYVEHGKWDYKVEEVEGKGMTSYVGVGGMGRVMVGEEVYIDMSMGVGGQGIEFDGTGLVLTRENIGYEYSSMYVGGHVGCGYKREVGEKVNVEVVGKVLMMRQEGKEVKLTNGVPVEFEGAMSGKIKGLVKAGYKCNEKVVPYVGVGYEYEFLGKAKGKVEGVEMKEIDLKGGSGIGEIGVRSEMGDININISGRGYIGEREGVEGMLKVGYAI